MGNLGNERISFIYKTTFAQDLSDIIAAANLELDDEIKNKVNEITRTVMNKAGIHFGYPYFNTATMAGIHRMTLKRFAEELGVDFPIKRRGDESPSTPWWFQK